MGSSWRWVLVLACSVGGVWALAAATVGGFHAPAPGVLAEPFTAPAAAFLGPAPVKPQDVALMRRTLADAASQGLDPKALIPPGLDDLLKVTDPDRRARGEAALEEAVLHYAKAVHSGRLLPADFDKEWNLRPAPFDPRPGFQAALDQGGLAQWLADLPPREGGYQTLIRELAVYRDIAARGGWTLLPPGLKLKPGVQDPQVPALRARLAVEDSSNAPSASDRFDPALVEALKAFQRRHGLTDDGALGASTLAALNVPVGQRIAQIEANLERWRWLPESLPGDRVEVNVAGAMATLRRDGQPVLTMKVAAGRKTDHTPMLRSTIEAIVINPPWNIPQSIADKEVLPKARANPNYLADEDIQVIPLPGGGQRLQQRAGPKSALGQVKFEFDSPFGVYLHDTPVKAAFDRASRLVSHGCVRLDKPRDLAVQLLQGQGDWTADSLGAAI